MTPTKLLSLLQSAVDRFNASIDRETLLLSVDPELERPVSRYRVAHEQAVAHRVAFYLECSLRANDIITDKGPLVVDCEYNQHLFDRKRLRVLRKQAQEFIKAGRAPIVVPGQPDVFDFEIRPDVVVHRRGFDEETNLMVLEIKRWTNPDRGHDRQKLELLTMPGLNAYCYTLGVAVYARNDWKEDCKLEVGPRFTAGKQFE